MSSTIFARLADVADINPRLKKRPEGRELISFVPMAAVDSETATVASEERRFDEVRNGYTLFENGDLLLAKITPCFENGKIAQALLSHQLGAGSTEFHVIRPDPDRLCGRYLLHFMRQPLVRLLGEMRMTGSGGQRRVPESFVAELRLPLPSVIEQSKMAAMLDRVDVLRVQRRKALAGLEELADSVFHQLFGDPVKNPREWDDSVQLEDVADVSSGITKGRRVGAGSARSIPYLAVLNVQDRAIDLSVIKYIDATEEEIKRYLLVREDLVITEGGDPDKLGRGSLWLDELPEAIHQNHVFRVRVKDRSKVLPLYLNWLLSSPRGKRYFLRSAKQTTGIASINMSQLRRFPILLPPVELQNEFAERIARIEKLKTAHWASLTELDALVASLQERFFRGAL
ncbi:restriction endonuclease subunit S [Micromonospora marina]|uniref:restriction endonuclease subunit S n=1 Tax=Micromonospora marina TaxID=307120 RepID=UPI003D734A7E